MARNTPNALSDVLAYMQPKNTYKHSIARYTPQGVELDGFSADVPRKRTSETAHTIGAYQGRRLWSFRHSWMENELCVFCLITSIFGADV